MANINIYGELNNDTPNGFVAPATQIKDVDLDKKQSEVNRELMNSSNNTSYLVCSTSGEAAAKTINLDNFTLSTNVRLLIKMEHSHTNTQYTPTLNIGGTGDKGIIYNGEAVSSENVWEDGEVLDVYYDGTSYICDTRGGDKFRTGQKVESTGIDDEPVAGSDNLVKSGGVLNYVNNQSTVQKIIGKGLDFTGTKFTGVLPRHTYVLELKNTSPSVPEDLPNNYAILIINTGSPENYILQYEIYKKDLPLKNAYYITIPQDITPDYQIVINTRSSIGYEQWFSIKDITFENKILAIGDDINYTRIKIFNIIPNHTYRIYIKNTNPDISNITPEQQVGNYRFIVNIGVSGNYTSVVSIPFDGNPLSSYYDISIPQNISSDYELIINTLSNKGYLQYFTVEDVTELKVVNDSIQVINQEKTSIYSSGQILKNSNFNIDSNDNVTIQQEVTLDSIAYENLTYRDIFETNNFLGISPGFENGNYSPLEANAGSPSVTSTVKDSGNYSLESSGSSSQQLKKMGYSNRAVYFAARCKCVRYVSGYLGMAYGNTNEDRIAAVNQTTGDFVTVSQIVYTSSDAQTMFIGSFSSANLDGYIDTPVSVFREIFTTYPSIEQFTELYNTYVYLKKTIDKISLETKKSNRVIVDSELLGEEVGYITQSNGLYHTPSNYYQGELINVSQIRGELIKFIPTISEFNTSTYAFLTDNVLQDGVLPNYASGFSTTIEISTEVECVVPIDANYLWVYTYRNSSSYVHNAPKIEVPVKYILSVLWKKQFPNYAYTDAISEFLAEMNAKASRLGMTSTRFTSPSGLDSNPSTANYSTAKDMLRLMIEAISYPRLMKVWGKPSWTMKVHGARARNIELESTVTNPAHDPNLAILLNSYTILGGKTGSITVGGVSYYNYCVVAEKNNKYVIATLFQGTSSTNRYSQMKILLDNTFGLLNDPSFTTSTVNAKCASCELPKVPTSLLQNHLLNIIYSENENTQVYIASTTKIMTCIVACESLQNTEQLYYVTTDDVGGSGDDLNPGDIASFEDMMMDTMLPSSNGCAHCIARITGNILLERKQFM